MYIFASFVKDQRNENQNYNEVSSHTSQNNHNQKKKPTNNKCQRGYGKRESSYTAGENAIDTITMENSMGLP